MAHRTVTTMIDDFDGSDAVTTARFSVRNTIYEIDLSDSNAAELEALLAPYMEQGRRVRGAGGAHRTGRTTRTAASARGRAASRPTTRAGRRTTAFSRLSDDEKMAFRNWADMPHARRISDARIEAWIAAGKPGSRRGPARAAKKAPARRSAKKAVARKSARPQRGARKRVARKAVR